MQWPSWLIFCVRWDLLNEFCDSDMKWSGVLRQQAFDLAWFSQKFTQGSKRKLIKIWKGDYLRPLSGRETLLPCDKTYIWICKYFVHIKGVFEIGGKNTSIFISFFKFLYCNFTHPNFSGPNFTSGAWISHSQGALYIHYGSESPFRNFFPGSSRQYRWEIRTACNDHSPQVISQTCSLVDPLLVAINSQL